MQVSTFTHGTAVQIETPENLREANRVGWGTRVTFQRPVEQIVNGLPVFDEVGPGSWFHIPLTSHLDSFGYFRPHLKSITLLFLTEHCRITNVHVWDGATRVMAFDDFGPFGLHGDFLSTRDPQDIDPRQAQPLGTPTFNNTLSIPSRPPVFSAVGISLFACAFLHDFGRAPFPDAVLTIAGGGAQFSTADEFPGLSTVVSRIASLALGR
jgi:hypothetical protein